MRIRALHEVMQWTQFYRRKKENAHIRTIVTLRRGNAREKHAHRVFGTVYTCGYALSKARNNIVTSC